MAEERGREQEGYLEHAFRAEPGLRFLLHPLSQSEVPKRQPDSNVTLDLRTFIGHSEPRSNHRRTFYRTALGDSTAFESSSQTAERAASRYSHFHPVA